MDAHRAVVRPRSPPDGDPRSVDVPQRPAWDKSSGKPFEFRFEPSLGLIEDVTIGSSGGLWIRGGIALRRETGKTYEIRNRVVVCRCGQSANKPYCDGTHAAIKWRDNLEGEPVGETLPEEVY